MRKIKIVDKDLVKKLQKLEEEFDVVLVTEDDALEFVKSDKEELCKMLDEECKTLKDKNLDFAKGVYHARKIVDAYMQGRIDEGY
jgi:hypothetical protein